VASPHNRALAQAELELQKHLARYDHSSIIKNSAGRFVPEFIRYAVQYLKTEALGIEEELLDPKARDPSERIKQFREELNKSVRRLYDVHFSDLATQDCFFIELISYGEPLTIQDEIEAAVTRYWRRIADEEQQTAERDPRASQKSLEHLWPAESESTPPAVPTTMELRAEQTWDLRLALPVHTVRDLRNELSHDATARIARALDKGLALEVAATAQAEAQWDAQAQDDRVPFHEYLRSGQAAILLQEAKMESIRHLARVLANELLAIGKEVSSVRTILAEEVEAACMSKRLSVMRRFALLLEAKVIVDEAIQANEANNSRSTQVPQSTPCKNEPRTHGQLIRYFRERCGWTQEQLAEKINLSRDSIIDHEQGRTKPSRRNLLKYSELFDKELNSGRKQTKVDISPLTLDTIPLHTGRGTRGNTNVLLTVQETREIEPCE
jgi:DNA-binding XRE family transcriptional regulator